MADPVDPRVVAAAAWLQGDDTAYENEPEAAVRAARGMLAAAARFDVLPPMSPTEIGRRLHNMVDELLAIPADWWDDGIYPTLRIGFRRQDGDMLTLVVGVEDGNDE
jgi:hypothetical protein